MRTISQARGVRERIRCAEVREPILKTLGAVARELREAKDVLAVEIGARIRHTEGVVSRFERGETVPRNLDLMVQAYADELDLDPADIWQMTIKRWRELPEAEVSPGDVGRRQAVRAVQEAGKRRQAPPGGVARSKTAQRRKAAG